MTKTFLLFLIVLLTWGTFSTMAQNTTTPTIPSGPVPLGCSADLSSSCFTDGSPGFCIGFASQTLPCKPHFYCPNSTVNNPASVPRICPASADCQISRMKSTNCAPQGAFEPVVCPAGSYCPSFDQILTCPEGKYCPIGTIEPKDCGMFSSCPAGSNKRTYYGGIIGCLVVDFFLIIVCVIKKWRDRVTSLRYMYGTVNSAKVLGEILGDIFIEPLIRLFALLSPKKSRNNRMGEEDIDAKKMYLSMQKNGSTDTIVENGVDGALSVGQEVVLSPITEDAHADFTKFIALFKKALNGVEMHMDFKFKNLGLKLPNGKAILNGVTGEIKSGRVTAIMGPSGAGKTTFMHTMMGKVDRTSGQLKICGKEAEMSAYKKVIGYVPQEDIMHRELTVRENILHSARVRLPDSWSSAEIEEYVDTILDILSLKEVAHQRIGDELSRGISGGQRKRVNIGMELASCPLVLCLDEPTSGLDSTAALNVALLLRRIANLGITVIAVIHQPRYEIFDALDDLLMIAPGGRTAYLGPSKHCISYFTELGYEFEALSNPADLLMDILSGRYENKHNYSPDQLVNIWRKYEKTRGTDKDFDFSNAAKMTSHMKTFSRPMESSSDEDSVSSTDEEMNEQHIDFHNNIQGVIAIRGASFWKQFVYCHNRSIVQMYATISTFWLEVIVGLVAGGLMGLSNKRTAGELYRGVLVEPYTLISAAPVEWLVPLVGLFVGLAIALAGAPAGAVVFGKERHIYYREAAAGHDRFAYYLAKSLSSIYRFSLSSFHFAALFYLLACPLTDFTMFFLFCFGHFFCVYGLSNLVAMFVKPENTALMSAIACMIPAVLCGYGPSLNNAGDWGMKWLWDLSYARWFTEAFYSTELTEFDNIYRVDDFSAGIYGYTLRRVGMDLGIGFMFGVVFRIVGFFLLISLNKAHQR